MKASKAWVIVIVLQVILLLGQWLGTPSLPAARAQIPDPAAQTNQVIDELKDVNAKLDRIADLLESGKLQVKATAPDERQGDGPGK